MLSTGAENGGRLAAVLPTAIGVLAANRARGAEPVPGSAVHELLDRTTLRDGYGEIRTIVVVVVDGLGTANLGARRGHAPTLARLPSRRIETVKPSTTGAALTTLVTGTLPGEHGLVGYRIRHPQFGLRTTLSEWEGIENVREWQHSEPLFHAASALGLRPVVIGRPEHRASGLTAANLSGARYAGGAGIDERFAEASRSVRAETSALVYVYVDELDRIAHRTGAGSSQWSAALETLDAALDSFLRTLPGGVGVVVTADHGIVDVPADDHVVLDDDPEIAAATAEFGGEPRFRSLYLRDPEAANDVAERLRSREGSRAVVLTRDEAISGGVFAPRIADGVPERLGDVLVIARKRVAYYASTDSPQSRRMVGQHGGVHEDELGVPIILAGELEGTPFFKDVTANAAR